MLEISKLELIFILRKKNLDKNLQMWYKMPKPHLINQFHVILLLLLLMFYTYIDIHTNKMPFIEVKPSFTRQQASSE